MAVKLVRRAVETVDVVIGRGTRLQGYRTPQDLLETAVAYWQGLSSTASLPSTWTGGDRYPGIDLQGVWVDFIAFFASAYPGNALSTSKGSVRLSYTNYL